ncbi:MAG: hypothetical protein ABGY24_08375 [bacterium]
MDEGVEVPAPRLQRDCLFLVEVVASINLRGARATLLLVEDVGNRAGGEVQLLFL